MKKLFSSLLTALFALLTTLSYSCSNSVVTLNQDVYLDLGALGPGVTLSQLYDSNDPNYNADLASFSYHIVNNRIAIHRDVVVPSGVTLTLRGTSQSRLAVGFHVLSGIKVEKGGGTNY